MASDIMGTELNIITTRRLEVEREIARLQQSIAELQAELPELATAEKVFLRLSGAIGPSPRSANAEWTTPVASLRAPPRHLTDVIVEIMEDLVASGIEGMEPKDALPQVRERWKPTADGTIVSTTFWRLLQQKRLIKDEGTSFYRLPKKELADDSRPAGETSSAMQPAEGREAAPGGGT